VEPAAQAEAGADRQLCEGDSTVLGGAPSASGGTPPYSYAWSPATGLDDPSSPNPVATPTADTIYRLELSDAAGCLSTDSVTLTLAAGDPGPVGNTLRQIKPSGRTQDLQAGWASSDNAVSYVFRGSPARDLTGSDLLATPADTTTTLAGAVLDPPAMLYTRVRGVSCTGVEGP
jgi:hypothetical protein